MGAAGALHVPFDPPVWAGSEREDVHLRYEPEMATVEGHVQLGDGQPFEVRYTD